MNGLGSSSEFLGFLGSSEGRNRGTPRNPRNPRNSQVGNIERVKRRMLKEAVAENLDVIRGMPPRALRPSVRFSRLWLRRAPFLLVPLTLLGSTYLIANGG